MDKHIDELTGKLLREMPLESPSKDFTTNILSKIEKLPQSSALVYKPLISKKSWFVIGLLVLGSMGYLFFGPTIQETGWFSYINFDKLPSIKSPKIPTAIRVPKTVIYAIGIFACLILVQIPVLKRNFDKRLNF
ncbi:hypothetical protein GGR42_000452 [Saonia flava]|uniref:Uncharacterized protein n=1 Tax=Saonia flava TaxID=523696 RepID=A0A846QSQ5_9FLAO|nr:hypothetical protein [Saonia flava]NJB69990.1 hypothetical protein [Saonia flava]